MAAKTLYDQGARYAAEAEPGFLLARLRPLTGLALTWRSWFDARAVPLPGGAERQPDLVAIADDGGGRAWLLIFEFQSRHDAEKMEVSQLVALSFRVYAKDADRDGAKFLPLPVLVYLSGRCPEREVAFVTPSGLGITGKPAIWEIGEDGAADALAKVSSGEYFWGAMFWVSLMQGGDTQEVLDLWVRLRDEKVPPKQRGNVTYVACQLAELIGRKLAWDRTKKGVDMTESAIANEMIELGSMRASREALTEFINGRFPELLTPDVKRAIADQPSLVLLREWIAAAGKAKTGDEFLAVLRR